MSSSDTAVLEKSKIPVTIKKKATEAIRKKMNLFANTIRRLYFKISSPSFILFVLICF
jgi:hypothetical protein